MCIDNHGFRHSHTHTHTHSHTRTLRTVAWVVPTVRPHGFSHRWVLRACLVYNHVFFFFSTFNIFNTCTRSKAHACTGHDYTAVGIMDSPHVGGKSFTHTHKLTKTHAHTPALMQAHIHIQTHLHISTPLWGYIGSNNVDGGWCEIICGCRERENGGRKEGRRMVVCKGRNRWIGEVGGYGNNR